MSALKDLFIFQNPNQGDPTMQGPNEAPRSKVASFLGLVETGVNTWRAIADPAETNARATQPKVVTETQDKTRVMLYAIAGVVALVLLFVLIRRR